MLTSKLRQVAYMLSSTRGVLLTGRVVVVSARILQRTTVSGIVNFALFVACVDFAKTVADAGVAQLMKLGRLNHVAIAVSDMKKSIHLYKNVLGARVSERLVGVATV